MKKVWKILLWIFISIVILLTLFILFVYYVTEIRITDITELKNEKNNYKIIFQAVGEPDWPFGSATVKITLLDDNNNKVTSFKDEIADDGGQANEGNIKVDWKDSYVKITLMGDEQENNIYQLEYDK